MGEIEEEGTRHFSVALIDRTRGNGYSLEGMKLHLNKRKTFFFYCEGDQTLEKVSQGGCTLSVSGDTQNLTGQGPGQAVLVDAT